MKITLTNKGDQDIQIVKTPGTFLNNEDDILLDLLEWDEGQWEPKFRGQPNTIANRTTIESFMNPMKKKATKGSSNGAGTQQEELEPDDVERKKRFITLKKAGLTFGSSSKTFEYDGMCVGSICPSV